MTKTVRKLFLAWQHEKEEQWLNQMSASGWQLTHPGLFNDRFEQGPPNQYQYALEYINLSDAKMKDYFAFLEEAGIEIIGQTLNWVYYRKANDGRPFEIFSDLASKTEHMQRLLKIYYIFFVLEGFFFIDNLLELLSGDFGTRHIVMTILFGLITLLFATAIISVLRQIQRWKKGGMR